ncbi:hypothetical protein E2I00_006136, partial [Balaenoptera physalus]
CDCNLAGVLPEICDAHGRCLCRPGVGGPRCDACRWGKCRGFYSFPICQACQCSALGSYQTLCSPLTGQCECQPGVTGQRCDRCLSDASDFPHCQGREDIRMPEGGFLSEGHCRCKLHVESPTCSICKPLYWNLAKENPSGCSECQCHVAGTVSGIGECGQLDGDCHCKSHVGGDSCDTCEDGYFALEKSSYFGCQGCQCDIGGAVTPVCSGPSGVCRCREHVMGKTCQRPENNYYFPDLHHMRYEIEDGTTPKGRALRFGFDPLEFPEFSWRGYAQMTSVQNEVRIVLNVGKSSLSLFRVVLRYINPGAEAVSGRVTIYPSWAKAGKPSNSRRNRGEGFLGADEEPSQRADLTTVRDEGWKSVLQGEQTTGNSTRPQNGANGNLIQSTLASISSHDKNFVKPKKVEEETAERRNAAQSKETIFQPSKEPAFVTVPRNGFADPFSIVPGTWIACIKAEGVLLDYLALLPRDYYEALSLQLPVTEPCADVGPPRETLMTMDHPIPVHLPVTRFPCALASEARHFLLDGESRPLAVRQPTPEHPVTADLSGREFHRCLWKRIQYISHLSTWALRQVELRLQLRVPRVGHYVVVVEYATEADQLSEADVHVQGPGADLAGRVNIYSCKYSVLCRSAVTDSRSRLAVYELLEDADVWLKARMARFLLLIVLSGQPEYTWPFQSTDATCITLVPETLPTALILDVPSGGSSPLLPRDPLPSADAVTGVTLKAPQNQVTLRGLVPRPGRYVIVVHFYQPVHPTFLAQVSVDRGRLQPGIFRASFCPHVLGCRDQVIAGDQVEFDISEPEVAVTVKVPEGKSLVWVRVLVVPAENYDYQILHRKSVDKSFEFVTNCGGDSFYIDPQKASGFCKDSARSLVALYHDGALPCECHPAGAIGHRCSPEGGQCPCRPHVIGRQCTRCQMGYYGFPHCKPCTCGRRLCEETMGMCLCPPRTVRPQCDACETHSFSFHPLAGCEGCNCSRTGTDRAATPECDRDHGQC